MDSNSFGLKNAPQVFQRRLGNIFRDLNNYCLVYINDILIISEVIDQPKHDSLLSSEDVVIMILSLGKNKCIYVKQEIEFLGLEIKLKWYYRKIKKFPEKTEDGQQLERFPGCLTHALISLRI